MAAKLEKLLRIFAYLMGKDYFCIRFYTMGFRSSVGLEQQPSKLWVLGSNPNGITSNKKEEFYFQNSSFTFTYNYLLNQLADSILQFEIR